jgi:hypothetical protein
MPRVNLVTTTNAAPLAAHVHGMTVFNMAIQNDVTPGVYYNDGSKWVLLSSGETQMEPGTNEGDVLIWNPSINQWEAQPEKDGIVGNEVTNATDGSLTRSGAGSSESPYTLAVSIGGIETKHLKDGAVTTEKIVNNAITTEKITNNAVTHEKLSENAVTTINIADNSVTVEKIGDEVWNEITNMVQIEEADGIIGNEVTNATDGSLTRSGNGTSVSPYTLAVSLGGIENKHIKDGAITTNKVVDKTITKEKLGEDVWNQVKTEITNSSIISEVDGIIGNEVIGAADASLTRSGSGTAISPYRLAVSLGGIETKHLKDGAITTEKIANNAITTEKIINNAVTHEKLADNAITAINITDNSVTNSKIINNAVTKEKLGNDVWNEIKDIVQSEENDGIIGNEVTNATDGSLTRSGAGSAISPYTLAVSLGGIETKHLKDGAVTTEKITNNAVTTEKIANSSITIGKVGDDVWNQIANIAKSTEKDSIIGNEVARVIPNRGLVITGAGTAADPLSVGMIPAQSNSILYTDASGNWSSFTRTVAVGVFDVPNDSLLTRCNLTLPNWGAGLYGIHITCDSDMPKGDVTETFFRFVTDRKPYGVGTRDVYLGNLTYFDLADSHSRTAWLYDCNPTDIEFYCTNKGDKNLKFRIVCSWLMPF